MTTNPYKSLIKDKDEEEQRQLEEKVAAQSHGHYTDKHIDAVTKDFCQWVADLGGGEDNIEEETVGDLFAIGHESKPPLSVPLSVIQLLDIPRELTPEAREEREKAIAKKKAREKRGKKKRQKSNPITIVEEQNQNKTTFRKDILDEMKALSNTETNKPTVHEPTRTLSNMERKHWVYAGINKSVCTREPCRYGAWYLEPNKWKKLKPWERLDCKEATQYMSNTKKASLKFDEELAPMHVTKSFMDYIHFNGKRKPDFFTNIKKIQDKMEKEETARAHEAEQHKQKLLNRMYRAKSLFRDIVDKTSTPPRSPQSTPQNKLPKLSLTEN